MIASQIIRRLATLLPRTILLGGHRISLPAGHRLDWYRFLHRRLRQPVADLSTLLLRKHNEFLAIDVGANIGDTAALMARSPQVTILCIEGNSAYLPKLRANLARISPSSEIEPNYLGTEDTHATGQVVTRAGTASIKLKEGKPQIGKTIHFRSLAAMLSAHPRFESARLFKVDTDGMDAKIILASSEVLARMRPVIFLEYDPLGPIAVDRECQAMIVRLRDLGYTRFHVFDNFGNHMLRLAASETDHLSALSAYVRSSRLDLRPALFYYDICALTDDDRDISEVLLDQYLALKE